MSYILDALRRAETERQRGAVPGLHAQATALGMDADAAVGPRKPPLLASGGLVLLLMALLGAAVWWLGFTPATGTGAVAGPAAVSQLPQQPQQPEASLPTAPAQPQPQPPQAPPAAPWPAQARTSVGAPPLAPEPAAAVPKPRTTLPAPLAAVPAALSNSAIRPGTFSSPAGVNGAADSTVALPANPSPAAAATLALPGANTSAAAPARLPMLAELPEAQRRELPALAVGGAVYADQPGQRMVILNGQVFHEGDRVAPDLQVQQIRLKSVVLGWRGQRFELPL